MRDLSQFQVMACWRQGGRGGRRKTVELSSSCGYNSSNIQGRRICIRSIKGRVLRVRQVVQIKSTGVGQGKNWDRSGLYNNDQQYATAYSVVWKKKKREEVIVQSRSRVNSNSNNNAIIMIIRSNQEIDEEREINWQKRRPEERERERELHST